MQGNKSKDAFDFVIASYRILLRKAKPRFELKKELRQLAKEYGRFVVIRQTLEHDYEIIFAKEKGYLLGESVQEHFKSSKNFIFCEQLEETEDCALVIVRGGAVVTGMVVNKNNVPEELTLTLSEEIKYDIYLYGQDIPFTEKAEEGKFSFPPQQINTFNHVSESVLNRLTKSKSLYLLPVDQAIKKSTIGKNPFVPLIVLGVIAVIGYTYWRIFVYQPPVTEIKIVKVIMPNPYKDYKSALESPDPGKVMMLYLNNLRPYSLLNGWKITKFETSKLSLKTINFSFIRKKGLFSELAAQVRANSKMKLSLKGRNVLATLDLSSKFPPNRTAPKYIWRINKASATFADRLLSRLDNFTVTPKQSKSVGVFVKTQYNVAYTDWSIDQLAMMAATLYQLPITMTAFKAGQSSNGLWSGTITVEMIGN
jgi:hypothetical protein